MATQHYIIFGVRAFLSLFYLIGFIAIAVFLTRLDVCSGPVCTTALADMVVSAIAYVAWVSSATITAMEISILRRSERKPEMASIPEKLLDMDMD